ncbi:hypothetical protein CF327_g3202 [Tilletia walkeri]|nr:hypothetical protein CF327_g3202 [Tilletia walkeri]
MLLSRLSLTGKCDLPDTVTQFLNQKRFLARKSSSNGSTTSSRHASGKGHDSSNPAPFSAYIELDDARPYFPGQLLKAKIHIAPEADPSQVEDITVEVKAWTHSYGWTSNGSSTYPVYEKVIHYSVEGTLPTKPQVGESTGLNITQSDNDPNTWLVSTRLPKTVMNKTNWRAKGETTLIPPTFKDVKSSLNNTVYWTIKITAKRAGGLKRNFRIWKPFIVLPLCPTPAPAMNLPMLVISPEGIPPNPRIIKSALPASWSTYSFESKLKTALVFSKAIVTTHLFLPTPTNIRPGPIPILLHVAVSAKKEADLLASGSVRLPDLPLSSTSTDDDFEQEILAGSKGSDAENPTKGKGKGKEDASQSFHPFFEIIRHTRSRGYGSYNSGRHRIPAFVQFDTPTFLSSDVKAGQAVDHGYAWTDPMPTEQAGLTTDVDLPFTRCALLTGRLMVNVPPPIYSLNLRMKYKLHFHWAQPGLGNTISAALGRWIASTGVTEADLDTMGERLPDDEMAPEQVQSWQNLDRRVLGPRYIWLRDAAAANSSELFGDGDDDDDDTKNSKFDDDDDEPDSKSGFFSKFMPHRSSKGDGESAPADGDDSDSDDSDNVADSKGKGAIQDQDQSAGNSLPVYEDGHRSQSGAPHDVKG